MKRFKQWFFRSSKEEKLEVKEEITEEITEEVIEKPKKEVLTVRKVIKALALAKEHQLDSNVTEYQAGYSQTRRRFTLTFDEHFSLIASTSYSMEKIHSLEIKLRDEKHEFLAYSLPEEIEDKNKDLEIIWNKNGPWVTILEKRVNSILEAYQYQLDREKREKDRVIHHFKAYFPSEFPKKYDDGEMVSYKKLKEVVEKAVSYELIKEEVNDTPSIVSLTPPRTTWIRKRIYTLECFVIEIVSKDSFSDYSDHVQFSLKDEECEMLLLDKKLETNDMIGFQEDYFGEALCYLLDKLQQQIEDKKQEKADQAADYFTKKYRLKTF